MLGAMSTRNDVPDATDLPDLGALMPLTRVLGIRATALHHDGVSASMAWRDELCTADGILHGGTLMAFADTVGATAAFLRLPEGATTTTVSSNTSFLAAVRDGTITARAFVEHTGRRFITVRTEVRDATDRLVSVTIQTQAVLA